MVGAAGSEGWGLAVAQAGEEVSAAQELPGGWERGAQQHRHPCKASPGFALQ